MKYGTYVVIPMTLALVLGWSSSPEEVEQVPPAELPKYDDEEEVEDERTQEDEENGVVGMVAFAHMHSGHGEMIGEVTVTQTEEGVEIDGYMETLDEDPKGFHVHEYGECDPPVFESAGGHFNPKGHAHGGPDDPPEERHAGDLGNIEFDEEGVSEFSFVDDVTTLGSGTNDIVGKALIVHYEEDDLETDPTGDSGAGAGCGIIDKVGIEESP